MEVLLLAVFLFSVFFLLFSPFAKTRLWTATVTPLASIIGSGFLVVAPLLHLIVGDLAPLAMLFIVILAYFIGEGIRFNIKYEEKLSNESFISQLETLSNLTLSAAFIISVAFYLRFLSAFLFEGFLERNYLLENLLTTGILLFIGLVGYFKGLSQLEWLEKYSVSIKLAVIFSLLFGLFLYDANNFHIEGKLKEINVDTLRCLAGVLLIVQGFETSKYLKEKYSKEERIKSMKIAQIISGVIYVVFIILVQPLLYSLPEKIDETAIIDITREVSFILPYILILGAVMSQFSASVADTIGSGELLYTETKGKVSSNLGFFAVSIIGIILVWSSNIFEIITFASRAFALYYLFQIVIALFISLEGDRKKVPLFGFLIPVLIFIVIFGEPIG